MSDAAADRVPECKECHCRTGGGDYCFEHKPYLVMPLADGTFRVDRFGRRRVTPLEPPTTRDALDAAIARAEAAEFQVAALLQALAESRSGLTLRALQAINTERAQRWHKGGLSDWSPLEWAGAMAGEAGEACNAAKKLKRIDDDIANINHEEGRSLTNREEACLKVGEEVADTIIYGVLLAERVGIDIEEAVRLKFNQKSEEYGFPERIEESAAEAALVPLTSENAELKKQMQELQARSRPSTPTELGDLAAPIPTVPAASRTTDK